VTTYNMPSINQNKGGGRITWGKEDWLSGLHPNYSASAGDTPVPRGNGQLTYARAMNPYRAFGYAAPGFNPTDVSNVSVVTSSAIRKIVIAYESGYFGYGINSSTSLFQIDTATGDLTNAGSWPHTITSVSGAVEGNDICAYSARVAGTRKNRIFYSFNNNGAAAANPLWNVGMYDLNGTFDDDFMTTAPGTPLVATSAGSTPTFTYPHPLIVGDDDVLYIGDNNKVHAYDGADTSDPDGKFFDSVLVLPETFRITGFARYQQRLAIFGYKELNTNASANASSFYATEAKVYFWDYLANDPYDSVNLNDNYVNAPFEYKGSIGCFTQGRKPVPLSNQFASLKLFNGDEFDNVAMFDSNIPVNGGVSIVGDTIMFNAQGSIYQFGSPYPGFPDGLNKVTEGSGTSSGALTTLATTLQVASTGVTTTGGLQKIGTNYNTGSMAAAVAEPQFQMNSRARADAATITFAKTSTGGRDVSVLFVGNDLATTTVVQNVSTINSANIRLRYEFATGAQDMFAFSTLKPIATWGSGSGTGDAPIIDMIELEYTEIPLEGA
jgi:hypothetical protein